MSSASAPPSSLTRPSRHLFLSPHYDDIPLSVGATVRLLANHGHTPESLVVFGSEPDSAQSLTPFARALHAAWGLTAEEVIASRRAEEYTASAILGAQSGVLPFRDAIYRGERYLSDDELFGSPSETESSLPGEIAAALNLATSPDPEMRFYAPLGIGRHVDHQMVFRAGTHLASQGWEVWFFEDIPYALKPGALESRLDEITTSMPLEPVTRVPAATAWEEKLDAIFSYPSQLEMVFRNYVGIGTTRGEISDALGAYARGVGEGEPAERFWRISDASIKEGS